MTSQINNSTEERRSSVGLRAMGAVMLAIFGFLSSNAQSVTPEVIASAGASFSSSTVSIEWTLGEIMTETYAGTIVLTQGFQQPALIITSINEPASPFGSVKVYPNPTVDGVFIEREKGQILQLTIYDMKGSLVMQRSIEPLLSQVDLSALSEGVYTLRLTDGKRYAQAIRIEKR